MFIRYVQVVVEDLACVADGNFTGGMLLAFATQAIKDLALENSSFNIDRS